MPPAFWAPKQQQQHSQSQTTSQEDEQESLDTKLGLLD